MLEDARRILETESRQQTHAHYIYLRWTPFPAGTRGEIIKKRLNKCNLKHQATHTPPPESMTVRHNLGRNRNTKIGNTTYDWLGDSPQ